jgi:hypothetical protein
MKRKRRARVVAAARQGFGSLLLKTTFADVRIDCLVEGLTCEIDLLLDSVQSAALSGRGSISNMRAMAKALGLWH